jgi:tetratricopeptide (TPR) repeat protein
MGTLTIAPPGESASAPSPQLRAQSPWIYKPWIDLTVGCGAWSAPLLLAGFFAADPSSRGWTVAFYFLALLSNYPHFMATVYRAYHKRDEFQKYRLYTLHVALLLALTGVVAHVWYAVLPWIFTLYIYWSPWHYTGQNFGLLMMFARRAGVSPTDNERAALRMSFIASYLLLLFSFSTGPSGDPLILSSGLPSTLTMPARASLALFFLCVGGWAVSSLAKRSSWRTVLPVATLALTQFLWFLLPVMIELFSGHEIPQTRYSSGLLAVLHSTQYLWITSYYQRKEARAAGNSHWSFAGYLVTLVAGGIALFIPGPWIVSRVFHTDFAASFLTFTALVNIHHFILDGKLWKLRDSRIASLLLADSQQPNSGAAKPQPSGASKAFAWLTGVAPSARAARIAAVVVLFAWAGMDQLHYWWSTQANSLQALQRAAELNPDDSSVWARLSAARESAGQRDAALIASQRAAALNPVSFAIQESYGRLLIESGRTADAYAQFQRMLAHWPHNADALVDYGLLAHRLGHDDEAIDSWQGAIAADPNQRNAQLYLGQMLDQRGELQAAARHYRTYLEILSRRHEKRPGETSQALAVLIRVADADAAANKMNDAARGYNAAIGFSDESQERTLESLALAHLGDLHEKLGDVAGAAECYQRALRLDTGVADVRSVASDWFNYAQLLKKQQEPERYVFACLLKAEARLQGASGDDVSVVKDALNESQHRLGHEAPEIRRKVDAVAADSLELKLSSTSAQK